VEDDSMGKSLIRLVIVGDQNIETNAAPRTIFGEESTEHLSTIKRIESAGADADTQEMVCSH
jgi:hypothetical protein